jgi:hypothetical protein
MEWIKGKSWDTLTTGGEGLPRAEGPQIQEVSSLEQAPAFGWGSWLLISDRGFSNATWDCPGTRYSFSGRRPSYFTLIATNHLIQ